MVLIPAVLIDKPFALRGLLFGELELSSPFDGGTSNDNLRMLSIDLNVGV